MVGARILSTLPTKTPISNRYPLVASQPKHLAKKSSVMTNRKSTTRFPMSLRWTACGCL